MSDVARIEKFVTKYQELKTEIAKVIVGQDEVVNQILISIFSGGHALLIGVPGLAKTLMVNTIAKTLGLDFKRIQFTPDLMPSDILGSEILDENRQFRFIKGPVFANIILADEINRTPPKTQAALLEAMQERAVTVAGHHYKLSLPYFVLATQNPIEQEGTYPLPEAQLDRFLMHVTIDYPDIETERRILKLVRGEALAQAITGSTTVLSQESVFSARKEVLSINMSETVEEYIVQLVMATREAQAYNPELANWIEYGASPRATISLDRCARAHAWLQGKDFVTPDDVQAIVHDVIRHRIILSFEAEANGYRKDSIIDSLLDSVPAP